MPKPSATFSCRRARQGTREPGRARTPSRCLLTIYTLWLCTLRFNGRADCLVCTPGEQCLARLEMAMDGMVYTLVVLHCKSYLWYQVYTPGVVCIVCSYGDLTARYVHQVFDRWEMTVIMSYNQAASTGLCLHCGGRAQWSSPTSGALGSSPSWMCVFRGLLF